MQLLRDTPICAPLSYNFIRQLLQEAHEPDQNDTVEVPRNCLDVIEHSDEAHSMTVVYVNEYANAVNLVRISGKFGSDDNQVVDKKTL